MTDDTIDNGGDEFCVIGKNPLPGPNEYCIIKNPLIGKY